MGTEHRQGDAAGRASAQLNRLLSDPSEATGVSGCALSALDRKPLLLGVVTGLGAVGREELCGSVLGSGGQGTSQQVTPASPASGYAHTGTFNWRMVPP